MMTSLIRGVQRIKLQPNWTRRLIMYIRAAQPLSYVWLVKCWVTDMWRNTRGEEGGGVGRGGGRG